MNSNYPTREVIVRETLYPFGATLRKVVGELVRCKDCKHRFEGEKFPNCCDVLMEMSQWLVEIPVKDEWHCGSGERREE